MTVTKSDFLHKMFCLKMFTDFLKKFVPNLDLAYRSQAYDLCNYLSQANV